MSLQYQLSDEQQKELDIWLVNKDIELNNRGCRRLSDVVNMAQLFKNFDNKLVDMHFYTSHGKLELRLSNWETFNLKVLRKSGLKLGRTHLQELAKGDPHALRALLYHLMCCEQSCNNVCTERAPTMESLEPCEDKSYESYLEWLKQQKTMEEITRKEPDNLDREQLEMQEKKLYMNAMINDYEEQKIMNLRKDEYIASLQLKINHLEQIIRTQDMRTKQLLQFLTKLTVKMLSMQDHLVPNRCDEKQLVITDFDE